VARVVRRWLAGSLLRPARRTLRKGFTLIEAMVSMVILAVGVLGVMSMQTGAVGALGISQDFSQVLNIGSRMLEMLRLDSLRWTDAGTLSTATVLLKMSLPPSQTAGSQSNWTTIPDGVLVTPMAGKKVDRDFRPDTGGTPNWPLGFRYCVYYRLTWVTPPSSLRADVRVAWPKDEGDRSLLADCAQNVGNVTDIANVRSITLSTGLIMHSLL
jgi:prepilin-type N-terminal cleavage/methylation domain-containing protein